MEEILSVNSVISAGKQFIFTSNSCKALFSRFYFLRFGDKEACA